MAPDQIDDLIHDEIRTHQKALSRIEHEKEWAERRLDELKAKLDCEHRREMLDGVRDCCRHCEFVWIRR